MSMGRGGIFGNPMLMPWEEDMERQRQRMEAEMGGQPQQPMQGGLLGSQQPQGKPPGFWQGGDKFRGKDAIAGLLAAIGDGLAQANGGQGWATQNLMGGRLDAMKMAQAAQAAQAKRMQELQDYEARKQVDQRYDTTKPDNFTQTLMAAGIDPNSPQGVALYRQRAATLASPAPTFVGDGMGGGRWLNPPAPSLPGGTDGLTPMTPEEIRKMGLPEGGPGGSRPGGFRPR